MTAHEGPDDRLQLGSTGPRAPLLVGRSREQALLRAQLSAAVAGRGGLAILSGEAGIGKTALAESICHESKDADALVLVGRCYEGTETPPCAPWWEILDQLRAVRDSSPALQSIAAPNPAPGSSWNPLFADMRPLLNAVARERPLVILLDDIHWSDTESLDLLRFVARQLNSAPILMIVTYRDDEVTREHPLHRLAPILVREALAVRIDLSPLNDNDVQALIERVYQLPAGDANRLAISLQQRAEGNPFFVGELLRSLEGTVLLPAPDGRWRLGPLEHTRVPRLLRQVIDQRLARLGAEAERLLAIAAVIGHVAPFAVWARVSGATEEALLALVEQAVDARIMDATDDGLAARFTHALIREALYDSVLPPRRRAWRRTIAETLLSLSDAPDPDEVAYHFHLAGDPRAVDWLTRAGERAQRAFAWRTAAQRFESALAQLDGDDTRRNERGWLRLRLALVLRFEDHRTGVSFLEEAERLGAATNDRALVAYARFYQGMLRCQGDDFRLGIAAEASGIAMLDALSPADHARLTALDIGSDPLDAQNGRGELTLALAENGRLLQARTLGEQIISLPHEQTSGSRGDAYYGLGYAYAGLGQPVAAKRAFASARELFIANDHRSMVTASLFDELTVVTLPYYADQPDVRLHLENQLAASFAALHDMLDERTVRSAGVVSAILGGAWAEAFEMLEQNRLRFMRRATPILLAPLARHRGEASLAWSLIGECFPAGPDTSPEDSAIDTMPLRALAIALALDNGDLEAAQRWLASFDTWLEWSGSVPGTAEAHLCWAAYHRANGEIAQAKTRAVQARAAASTPRQPLMLLAAHRLLGELDLAAGQLTEADRHLGAALKLADACGARHELALTLLAQSDLLRARGDLSGAQALLGEVRSICGPMKAALTLAQADALAARLPPATAILPAGLSTREAEVIRCLAAGLTSAEIAGQLFVSPRTIEAHLTSIYGKLGVTTRGAAIRFALEHDLG